MAQFKTQKFTFFAPRTVIFCENPESNTYCIFNSDKISDPIHEEVYIDTDDELKEFLLIAEKNDK